jgi:hypothetical protein
MEDMIHERLSTCRVCARWAATTEKQWQRRQTNIRNDPQIDFARCPNCDTINWALTRMHIVEEPDRPYRLSGLSIEAWIAIVLIAAVLIAVTSLLIIVRAP